VTVAEAIEHQGHAAISDQGRDTHHTHDISPWQSAVKSVPCRAAQHPKGEGNQGASLGDGSAGAPCDRHSGHAETDGVVSCIAEEIEWLEEAETLTLQMRESRERQQATLSDELTRCFLIRPLTGAGVRSRAIHGSERTQRRPGSLQTVPKETKLYHRLISEFRSLISVPTVLHTSFNENERVVCRPEEAVDCFRRTRMDVLVLGDTIITKNEPTPPAAPVG